MSLPYASLTKDGKAATAAACQTTHERRVTLTFYRRRDNKVVTSMTNTLLSGSVKGSTKRTPVTYLECDLFDEGYELDWTNGEHRHFDVKVTDARFVPALNDWVTASVFRGPIWNFSRTDRVVSLVAEDAAKNAQGSVRRAYNKPAKTRAVVVMRDLLMMAGARKADIKIANVKDKLPRDVTVGVRRGERRDTNGKAEGKGKDNRKIVQRLKVSRKDTYYDEFEKIAEAVDLDPWVDGDGKFCATRPKQRPSIKVDESLILAPVTEKRADEGEQPNVWLVEGKEYKKRKQPHARVELPKSHPASAEKTRWNGTERQVIRTLSNPQVKNNTQAKKLGRRQRDKAIRETVNHEVSCVPFLLGFRPFSLASFPVNGGRATGQVPEWTYPLSGNDPLVLGAIRRRSPK